MSERHAALVDLLRGGSLSAAEIAAALQVSQPTVSRLLAAAGDAVVRLGRGRASRYALARETGRAGRHWPLYRIGPEGRAERLGALHGIHGGQWAFIAEGRRPALLHGESSTGLFPGLPWFMDDMRPQGFLGRAFARRVAAAIGAPEDVVRWQAEDIVLALLLHGEDAPGDLVLGEDGLQRALQSGFTGAGAFAPGARAQVYPQRAADALAGEPPGSSAAGEQPKFTAVLDHGAQGKEAVIVKFSERRGTPVADRWADLLHCEHIAATVLRDHGLEAARTAIVEADGRVFLQSTRFDRTPVLGRKGFVSLAALDAAFYGHGRIPWWQFAPQLARDGWLDRADGERLALYGWFGALIGNSDMHLGNAGLVLADTRPLALAPAYDMLPMAFRPQGTGEVVARAYEVALPTPESHRTWSRAAAMASGFWHRARQSVEVSAGFRGIAADAATRLDEAIGRHG